MEQRDQRKSNVDSSAPSENKNHRFSNCSVIGLKEERVDSLYRWLFREKYKRNLDCK
jgi:hypothetical protein